MAELGAEAPPVDEADRETRRDGWRNFLTGVQEALQDPVRGQVIMQLGAGLAQDTQQGQSSQDFVSRALQNANAAGGRAEEGLRKQENVERVQERRDQALDLERQGLQQRGEIASAREEGADRRLGATLDQRTEEGERQEAQNERRFQIQQTRLTRQMAAQEQQFLRQMQSSELNHAQRMEVQKQLFELKKEQAVIANAGASDKTKLALARIAMEGSVDTDIAGNESVNMRKFNNTLDQFGTIFGVDFNIDPQADTQTAMAILQNAKFKGKGLDWIMGGVEWEQLDSATQAMITSLSEGEDGAMGTATLAPESGTQAAPTRPQFQTGSREELEQSTEAVRRGAELRRDEAALEASGIEVQGERMRDAGGQLTDIRKRLRSTEADEGDVQDIILELESLSSQVAQSASTSTAGSEAQSRMVQGMLREAKARLQRMAER